MSEFDILRAAAAGMDAQRSALDLAARNVAAAEATPTAGTFERLVPRFAVGRPPTEVAGPDAYEPPQEAGGDDDEGGSPDRNSGDEAIRYVGPTAERGVDVDAVTEMVSVLNAQRAYEANASVFDVGKRLAERTIDMGRVE